MLQLGFHFLILFLNHVNELECFIFYGTKAQIFGDKRDAVFVPYLTVSGFLTYNSLYIRKPYSIALLTSPNIVGKYGGLYKF